MGSSGCATVVALGEKVLSVERNSLQRFDRVAGTMGPEC
jgi:hypothetical protein